MTALIESRRGLRYQFQEDDRFIARIVSETGQWEEDVAKIIEAELQPGWTFLDVGAGVGYFSMIAARMGNPVIAIEADRDAADLIAMNAGTNGLNVTVISRGIGDWEGTGRLFLDTDEFAGNPGARHLRQDGEHNLWVSHLANVIECRPEFIKLDIEGLEGRVIRDSEDIFSAARVVVLEVSVGQMARYQSSPREAVDALASYGFAVSHPSGIPWSEPVEQLLTTNPYSYMNLVARRAS